MVHKNILILRDDRTGNFRQAYAAAMVVSDYLKKQDIQSTVDIQEIEFRNKFSKPALILMSRALGKYLKRSFWCLRLFLKPEVYKSLLAKKADIIISGGSAVAPANIILSARDFAKSIVVMKPPTPSLKMFNLAIIPRHDNPPSRENIVTTEGALNLIDRDYLEKQTEKLRLTSVIGGLSDKLCIGLLIGGDAKGFRMHPEVISEVIKQIKSVSEELDANILATTSRRTPEDIEELLKRELRGFNRCKLLVIANEKNIPEAVGAILGLSQIVVTSPESIMMLSEAVNSEKKVLVFESPGLSKKHRRFLDDFAKNKYIYVTLPSVIGQAVKDISLNEAEPRTILRDRALVEEALSKIM